MSTGRQRSGLGNEYMNAHAPLRIAQHHLDTSPSHQRTPLACSPPPLRPPQTSHPASSTSIKMHFPSISLLVGFLASTTLALPSSPASSKSGAGSPFSLLAPRQSSCAETCGTVCYYQTTIDNAVAEGYQLYQDGETDGSNKYPHA